MKPTKREFHKFIQASKKHDRIKRLLERQRILRRCRARAALALALVESPSRYVN
jgi:hypothetical protein